MIYQKLNNIVVSIPNFTISSAGLPVTILLSYKTYNLQINRCLYSEIIIMNSEILKIKSNVGIEYIILTFLSN